MKKGFIKLTSVVLTLMLIMSSVSVFALSTDARLTVGDSSCNINIGVTGATELAVSDVYIAKSSECVSIGSSNKSQVVKKDGYIAVYKLTLPQLELGKRLDKYILRFPHNSSYDTNWVYKKVSVTDISALRSSDITSNEAAQNSATPLAYKCPDTIKVSNSNVQIGVVDISDYALECYKAGMSEFYVAIYKSSGSINIPTFNDQFKNVEGFNGADTLPYTYYTTADVDALTLSSVTEPQSASDDLTYVFSNPIEISTVTPSDFVVTNLAGETVAVSNEDITVSEYTVTLDLSWEKYGYYSVNFGGISDIYGQSLATVCSTTFEISAGDSAETQKLSPYPVKQIKKADNAVTVTTVDNKIDAKGSYVLYKFDLSGIPANKKVVSAKFNWTSEFKSADTKTVEVIKVPNGDWTTDSAGMNLNYYNAVDAAYKSDANVVDTITQYFGNSKYTKLVGEADVTAAIEEAIAADEAITFAFYYKYTWNYYGNGSSASNADKPSLTIDLVTPSFDAMEVTPEKCGAMNGVGSPVKVLLATTVAPEYLNNEYIKLVNAKTGIAAENVAVSSDGAYIIITPTTELEEYSEYKVVLKAGITDVSGASLDSDKVISRFTTGTALELFDIKFTTDESPVYDSVAEIGNYSANMTVTAVTKIKNGSTKDLDAIMIIAIYGADESLIAVDAYGGKESAVANAETQFAKTITVPQDAENTTIKAFVWDKLSTVKPILKPYSIAQTR